MMIMMTCRMEYHDYNGEVEDDERDHGRDDDDKRPYYDDDDDSGGVMDGDEGDDTDDDDDDGDAVGDADGEDSAAVMVPPVPTPETMQSTLPPVSAQISSAVVLR